ncbi:hypothetical protein PLICRDRAFT_32881 [Plicaturopsis crispa FD-325 SS-3]|uniref:Uncharacterized protein n=1 Tax=Plicaturopsis crispa FD-325 SS-3 TaxID=944288 RepID=A0A0C9SQB2_PLICR|nr:hypothetical protein PLICRDRAFT_32881 [Plicaturopsis crispa FD-325 SS-3]
MRAAMTLSAGHRGKWEPGTRQIHRGGGRKLSSERLSTGGHSADLAPGAHAQRTRFFRSQPKRFPCPEKEARTHIRGALGHIRNSKRGPNEAWLRRQRTRAGGLRHDEVRYGPGSFWVHPSSPGTSVPTPSSIHGNPRESAGRSINGPTRADLVKLADVAGQQALRLLVGKGERGKRETFFMCKEPVNLGVKLSGNLSGNFSATFAAPLGIVAGVQIFQDPFSPRAAARDHCSTGDAFECPIATEIGSRPSSGVNINQSDQANSSFCLVAFPKYVGVRELRGPHNERRDWRAQGAPPARWSLN